MVFSLVFNYVYKRKLDEAQDVVERFLGVWHRCVIPSDAGVNDRNLLLELEEKQAEAMKPIVDAFITQMNRSMGNTFAKLSDTMDAELRLQQSNAQRIKEVLDSNSASAQRYNSWLSEQERTLRELHRLTGEIPDSMERSSGALVQSLNQAEAYFNDMVTSLKTASEEGPKKLAQSYVGLESAIIEETQAVELLSARVDDLSKRLDPDRAKKKTGLFK